MTSVARDSGNDGGLGQEAHGRRSGAGPQGARMTENEQARRRTGKRITGRKRAAVEEDWGLG
jgi:hypothetical protein